MNIQNSRSVRRERPLAYFMVRLDVDERARSRPRDAAALSGIVERLGTGDKRPFYSAEDLARLLAEWQSALAR